MCEELHAGVVVLGIWAVQAFQRLLGNTAEHVIDKLKCDLLAIKPDGLFVLSALPMMIS